MIRGRRPAAGRAAGQIPARCSGRRGGASMHNLLYLLPKPCDILPSKRLGAAEIRRECDLLPRIPSPPCQPGARPPQQPCAPCPPPPPPPPPLPGALRCCPARRAAPGSRVIYICTQTLKSETTAWRRHKWGRAPLGPAAARSVPRPGLPVTQEAGWRRTRLLWAPRCARGPGRLEEYVEFPNLAFRNRFV